MHALIDADIFCYSFGAARKEDGNPLQWPFVISRMDGMLQRILEETGSESHQLYLTGKGNFRESIATIKPYKGHRTAEKPYWYQHVKDFLIYHREAEVIEGMEADDALGIAQYQDVLKSRSHDSLYEHSTVICSLDKDLDMIPGYHYNWNKEGMWCQDEINSIRCFYCQLLTGDATDNIPGLYGVGKSSTLLRNIKSLDSELSMFLLVREEYSKRFGSYWKTFLIENARLLWILREEGEDVAERLDKLDSESKAQEH